MYEKELNKAFKALGETSRLQILKMLSVDAMCVCELSEVLDMSQPRVSQHLRTLKEAGLVNEQKEGYWTLYSLNYEALENLWNKMKTFLNSELNELSGYEEIDQRYQYLPFNEKVKETKEKLKHLKNNPSKRR